MKNEQSRRKLIDTAEALSYYTGVRIRLEKDFLTLLESFSRESFLQELQPLYTRDALLDTARSIGPGRIRVIPDPLGTRTLLFFIRREMILIGPYVESEFDSEKLPDAIAVNPDLLAPFRLYRSGLPICSTEEVLRAARTLIVAAGLSTEKYELWAGESVSYEVPDRKDAVIPLSVRTEQRYRIEHELTGCIERGDAAGAKKALQQMLTAPREGLRLSLWSAESSQAIMRTIVRLAAARSGLAPMIVDAISQEYAQRMKQIGSDPYKTPPLLERMIEELCLEIRKMKIQNYSQLTQKVLYYIGASPASPYTLPGLAAQLGVSESTLSHRLKEDTGRTLSDLVRQERGRAAVRLLLETSLPIQEIAAQVGYPDNNYFVKVFRSLYGATPSEFRKRFSGR